MSKRSLRLTFTSFRDAKNASGLKFSINRKPPSGCFYPTLGFLTFPKIQELMTTSTQTEGDIYRTMLAGNSKLIQDFLIHLWEEGVEEVVFCCWCTERKMQNDMCYSPLVGQHITENLDLPFAVEINYRDGRSMRIWEKNSGE